MLGRLRRMGRALLLLCGVFAFGLLVVTTGGGGGRRSSDIVDAEDATNKQIINGEGKRRNEIKAEDRRKFKGQRSPQVFPDDHYRRLMHFVQVRLTYFIAVLKQIKLK